MSARVWKKANWELWRSWPPDMRAWPEMCNWSSHTFWHKFPEISISSLFNCSLFKLAHYSFRLNIQTTLTQINQTKEDFQWSSWSRGHGKKQKWRRLGGWEVMLCLTGNQLFSLPYYTEGKCTVRNWVLLVVSYGTQHMYSHTDDQRHSKLHRHNISIYK